MVHTLRLDNYSPTPRKLVLGTNSSYGTESIKIERGAGWDGLNLTATWHIPGREEPLRVALLDGDAMDVPPEVTKEAKDGVLVLAGLASGVQRASCNVEYLILEQAGIYGGTDAEPTPELAAQVIEAALQAKADAEAAAEDAAAAKANADKAKADAEKAQQAAENAAADAAKAGPYAEAARAAQEAAESARDEAIAAQQAAENAAAAAAASKSAADTLAAEAARAAQAAENSKAAANNAANLAGENATAAQQAAATATAAANDAGQSASDAATSKAAAETAAKAAQDAKTAAAAAKAEAVKAQEAAQTAAKSAQDAQAAAEKARDEAKAAQKGAEAARDAAAGSAEAAAKSEENAKQSADTLAESVENVAANTAAVAELKQQVKNITPDNSSIGDKPWSSKHIVDMLCPPLEESGNPVVCYPVAGYSLGVKASWEPVQEGSGTPYPAGGGKQLLDTNKCVPTVGKPYGMTISLDGDVFKVSGVPNEEVTATEFYSFAVCTCSQEELRGKGYKVTAWAIKGKVNNACGLRTESENSLAIAAELTPGVNNDIQLRLMVSKDNPTAWEPYENIRPIKGRDSVRVERCGANLSKISDISTPNKSLTPVELPTEIVTDIEISFDTLNAEIEKVGTAFLLNKADGKWKAITVQDFGISTAGKIPNGRKTAVFHGVTFKTVETVIIKNGYCKWRGDVNNFCVSIIQNAPYTPYTGQTNTLTLPETVYGGEVDAVTGEGQETQKLVILNGTESWNSWGINAHNPAITGFYTYDINDYDAINSKGICSHLETPNQDVWGGRNAGIGFATVGSSRYFMFSMMTSSLPDISAGHEVASLKAYLAAQNDAGTPVQIAYKLAEPIPFTATGAQPLPALAGANTVLTDADSTTVTGRADPIKRIEDLEAAVASIN